ncbi:MAG TPA: SDR family oxidoreductase [Pirellulales bacterium]|jgi:NAD(P)-dependent dehydrogenase (short-subunit alcohol dehydrogenase family)|nr:SDR family oxidoreductase [Pirellulales bacterium]
MSIKSQTGRTENLPVNGEVLARFVGKTAVITGASDQGIGGAVAERLAREGASVVLLSRSEPKRLVKRLHRMERGVLFVECDVTRSRDVQRSVEKAVAQFGQLDVLVNNAGVECARPFESFTDDQWQGLLEVNLHGAIRLCRAVLPHIPASGGAIVNVASALALGGCPSFSIYSAGKAGLIGLTQSLAWELAPRKIRVLAIAPALVATPMTMKHMQHLTPEVRKQLEAIHPLGVGMPHDVAGAVAFLASEDAAWITGATLPLGWAPHYALPVAHFMTPVEEAVPPASASAKPR